MGEAHPCQHSQNMAREVSDEARQPRPREPRGPVILTEDMEGRCARGSVGMMIHSQTAKSHIVEVETEGRHVSPEPELERQTLGISAAPSAAPLRFHHCVVCVLLFTLICKLQKRWEWESFLPFLSPVPARLTT